MKFVTFLGSRPVHAADEQLQPLCGQTDGHAGRRVQQVITDCATCARCKRCLVRLDKNSPENRTRRRYLAARQALRDGRVGVEFFERRTTDRVARKRGAVMVAAEIKRLAALLRKLRAPVSPPPKTQVR